MWYTHLLQPLTAEGTVQHLVYPRLQWVEVEAEEVAKEPAAAVLAFAPGAQPGPCHTHHTQELPYIPAVHHTEDIDSPWANTGHIHMDTDPARFYHHIVDPYRHTLFDLYRTLANLYRRIPFVLYRRNLVGPYHHNHAGLYHHNRAGHDRVNLHIVDSRGARSHVERAHHQGLPRVTSPL